MRDEIEKALKKALESIGAPEMAFALERPGEFEHGDYATNAALIAGKALKKNPKEIAENLKKELEEKKIEDIKKIEIAGAGFINFFLSDEAVADAVKKAATDVLWGKNDLHAGKVVMVEYTDPNPFKEFHIGHLMSNAIGESIARLFESSGAKVIRANYQGDVGPHVAKAIWGKLQKSDLGWGKAYAYGAEAYEKDLAAKKEIDAINKKVYEKSDTEINALYDAGRKISLERFEELYKMLGTKFDFYFFESESWKRGLALVQKHTGDVFEKSDGAVVFKGEKVGLHTRVFINSQGLPTYEAKDLGLLQLKTESGALDISMTITANEQTEYFKVMLAAAKELPEVRDIANKTTHISHGMMRMAQGKMSSRKGNVITGESLLFDLQHEAETKIGERELKDPKKVAEQVAVGAIKYAVLKQGSGRDIVFDPEQSLSLEGDSGPYLQYARVRALSLLKKAKGASAADSPAPTAGLQGDVSAGESAASAGAGQMAQHLSHALMHFPEVVNRAATELEPHYLATYLTELAGLFNSWYANSHVIGTASEARGLLLAQAFEHTMRQGLEMLGIPAPDEM